VNDEPRDKLVWGWLRVLLGWAQMLLAAAALSSLAVGGQWRLSLMLAGGALAATALSLLIYRGRRGPQRERCDRNE
jgi:hypothetical protein